MRPTELVKAFKKILGKIEDEPVEQAMNFIKNDSGLIPKEDFFSYFNSSEQISPIKPKTIFAATKSPAKPATTSPKRATLPPPSPSASSSSGSLSWIKKFDQACLEEGITPTSIFKAADKKNKNIINTQELKTAISRALPENILATKDIMQITKTFDSENKNSITLQQYMQIILESRNSPHIADVSKLITPSKHTAESKMASNQHDQNQKFLPVRGNLEFVNRYDSHEVAKGIRDVASLSDQTIMNIVNKIEKNKQSSSIPLKQCFAQADLNPKGVYLSVSLNKLMAKHYSSLTTSSERMLLIKHFDSKKPGTIHPNDLLQFLQIYSTIHQVNLSFYQLMLYLAEYNRSKNDGELY